MKIFHVERMTACRARDRRRDAFPIANDLNYFVFTSHLRQSRRDAVFYALHKKLSSPLSRPLSPDGRFDKKLRQID